MDYGKVASIPGGDSFLGEKGPTEGRLIMVILPYVVMIVVVPITSFFFSKSFIFQDILGLEDTASSVYGAVVSVVILHVLLALFIYKAYKETPIKGLKQD